jgi:hypothetical protein
MSAIPSRLTPARTSEARQAPPMPPTPAMKMPPARNRACSSCVTKPKLRVVKTS